MRITNLWPKGKTKAFTLSYDDGVAQDIRLVDLFNRYRLKATFNLNSGIQNESSCWVNKGVTVRRMNVDGLKALYEGHEIAVHSLTHPNLAEIPRELVLYEIIEDKKNLEKIAGYPVRGMAYPFGAYNDTVIDVLKACGIEYSRTVKQHESFGLPRDFHEWHPTCHHKHPRLTELAEAFLKNDADTMSLFYVWGHSYEFDTDNNWEAFERFCGTIGNREEIWYATNMEIVDYLKAQNGLKYSADGSMAFNPSYLSVWIKANGQPVELKPGSTQILSSAQ